MKAGTFHHVWHPYNLKIVESNKKLLLKLVDILHKRNMQHEPYKNDIYNVKYARSTEHMHNTTRKFCKTHNYFSTHAMGVTKSLMHY